MKRWIGIIFLVMWQLGLKAQNLIASHMWTNGNGSTMSIEVLVKPEEEEVVLTFEGPTEEWFGYGFGNSEMEGTYTITIERIDGLNVIKERQLARWASGTELTPRYSLLSESEENGLRKLQLMLPITDDSPYFSFPTTATNLPIISAAGYGGTLGFHGSDNYMQGFQGGINDLEFSSVVPVMWSRFDIKASSSVVELDWKTASEYDNLGFHVQRSSDASDWIDLGFVQGKNAHDNQYHFVDRTPLPGAQYYRLMQVDLDGTANYSTVRSIEIGGREKVDDIQVFPNPVSDKLYIEKAEAKGLLRLQVFDMNYNVVRDLYWDTSLGRQAIDVRELPVGYYLLMVKHLNFNAVKHFVKQ